MTSITPVRPDHQTEVEDSFELDVRISYGHTGTEPKNALTIDECEWTYTGSNILSFTATKCSITCDFLSCTC